VLLVAATNVDLSQAIAAGRFRPDLFYRLNTVEIALPSLCDRADFESIVRHLLGDVAPDWQIDGAAITGLRLLSWPGNLRELRAMLTRLSLGETAGLITVEMIPGMGVRAAVSPAERPLREMLHERIRAVYQDTVGDVSETARRLRVSRNTVYRALPNAPGGTA